LADDTEWTFSAEYDFNEMIASEFKGYEAKATAGGGRNEVSVRVSKDGKELFTLLTHWQAVVRQRDGVVYYTDFHGSSSGCAVVAFDLAAKKQLWRADLKGLGPITHFKYRNEVRLEVLDDDTLRVFGKESFGRYVEIVSRTTGKTVGHKVFAETK
jgi:hypothetical protein